MSSVTTSHADIKSYIINHFSLPYFCVLWPFHGENNGSRAITKAKLRVLSMVAEGTRNMCANVSLAWSTDLFTLRRMDDDNIACRECL